MSEVYFSTRTLMQQLLDSGWELHIIPRRKRQYAWIARRGVTTIMSTRHEVARDHCVKAAHGQVFNLDEVSA
jgi:hypothetical protein